MSTEQEGRRGQNSLALWLKENARPAGDYVVDLYQDHQVVIFGEQHNIREHKEFVTGLLPRLYHEAGVRCLAWEFSAFTDNETLHQLVTGPEFNREALLAFARKRIDWNSKEHWDLIEAVWRLNRTLGSGEERMRFVGLDISWEEIEPLYLKFLRKNDTPAERLRFICERDRVMARQVREQIMERGLKGFVFVGRCHDFTLYAIPPEINCGRPVMGHLLYQEYGDRVFQIWPHSTGIFRNIEEPMGLLGHVPVGFMVPGSPFAGFKAPEWFSDAPGVPLERLAQGYVYLAPVEHMHRNTTIPGFVTPEMFSVHREFYEADWERRFQSAQEVDEYFQAHRWPEMR